MKRLKMKRLKTVGGFDEEEKAIIAQGERRKPRALGDITNLVTKKPTKKAFKSLSSVLSARSNVASRIATTKPKDPVIINIDDFDKNNELAEVEYVEDIYIFYKLLETQGCLRDYMDSQPDINAIMRAILLDWLIQVHSKYGLISKTLYLTINIVDRYLSVIIVARTKLQLVGISVLLISSKYEEIWPLAVNDMITISGSAYSREQIWYAKASLPTDNEMENMVFLFTKLGLMDYLVTIRNNPSMLDASAVYVASTKLSLAVLKLVLFPAVKGWLDEDLDNYHLKELRCSTQCHTQMSMWIISRGVVLLILLMEYKVLRDFLLHRSSINNSARLSNKFGGFYFSFKFDISGLLHHVITTIAYRIRGGSLLALKCLVWFMKYYANVRRTVADFSHAPLNEYSPSPDDKKQWSLVWFDFYKIPLCTLMTINPTHAYYNGSRTSKDNEDPGWNTSFKTRRTQKTTSAVEALWKTILRCYLYLLGTLVNRDNNIPEPAQEEGAIEVTYDTLGDQGHMIIMTSQQGAVMSKRISDLEQDNKRLRGMLDVATTMTREAVNELIARRVAEVLKARDAARNLEPLAEGGDEQEDENGDDYEGGNGGGNINGGVNRNGNGGGNGDGNGNRNGNNGNGNGGGNGYGNHNVNLEGFMPVARECTFQDFLKCQLLNFNGTEGVVGLTCWFEKMETVFHISNYPQKYQVKYATCTQLNDALTRRNSHKRTISIDAAYDMRWTELIKSMTEVYCLRNEIQKMETELWNLPVKRNDLTAYTQRF
ncbi:cyclin [Tanacetum coccineum]